MATGGLESLSKILSRWRGRDLRCFLFFLKVLIDSGKLVVESSKTQKDKDQCGGQIELKVKRKYDFPIWIQVDKIKVNWFEKESESLPIKKCPEKTIKKTNLVSNNEQVTIFINYINANLLLLPVLIPETLI